MYALKLNIEPFLLRPSINGERVILPDGFLTPIPLKYEEIYNEEVLSGIRVGEVYTLSEDTCEGFEIPANVYECKHILKEYGGVTLNSVVMKQVHGSDDLIFSLSKADCRSIGIAFEPKLQLFPMGLNWKRISETLNMVFNPVNMGTYKPSPKDNTIHQMHVVLEGIRQNSNAYIQTPLGKKISLMIFLETIAFKFKDKELQRRFPITYKTLTNKENSEKVVINDGIGFMLYFGAGEGISPQVFNGKTIDQLIEVSWIDPSLPSTNVYNNNPYYVNNEIKKRIFFPPI